MVYGGTIRPGRSRTGQKLDVVSAFQSYGEFIAGNVDEATRSDIVRHACPGAGACGGMYTANTMASAIETLGMALPGSSSTPAEHPAKRDECRRAGAAIRGLLERDLRPSHIMTRQAFENAMVVVAILGGSTNAVLHLIAMARSVGVMLELDDFQRVSDRTPFLADLKPSGQYVMEDLFEAGGIPALHRMLLERGALDGDCMTVTGRSLAENVADWPDLAAGQPVIRPWSDPIKETGHIQILRGSLAPEGAVAKITGKEGLSFAGPAIVFDREEDMLAALETGRIERGQVIVIR
jgi:dihydroxy-acid dehydratase